MINMLPPNTKKELRAARTNVTLLKYLFVLILAVAFLGSATYGVHIYFNDAAAKAEELIKLQSTNTANQSQPIELEAQVLRNNLLNAKNILDSGINYSDILLAIAKQLPDGVIIKEISLNSENLNQPIQLNIFATSTEAALKTESSFGERPEIFSSISLQSLSSSTSSDPQYPVSAAITFTINRISL
jgi:Tfp pilus assembly protein PilN